MLQEPERARAPLSRNSSAFAMLAYTTIAIAEHLQYPQLRLLCLLPYGCGSLNATIMMRHACIHRSFASMYVVFIPKT